MEPKVDLKFGNIIAHFIPGILLFVSLLISISFRFESYLTKNEIFQSIILNEFYIVTLSLTISLALGLIIDALRYLIVAVFIKIFAIRIYDMSSASVDDIKYHDYIIDNHYRYHQFYGNLSLSLLFSSALINWLILKSCPINLLLCLIIIICMASSILTYRKTLTDLQSRFPETKPENNGREQMNGPVYKKIKQDLKTITTSLASLSRQTDTMAKKVDRLEKAQAATKKKAAAKKKAVVKKKSTAKKKTAKKRTAKKKSRK